MSSIEFNFEDIQPFKFHEKLLKNHINDLIKNEQKINFQKKIYTKTKNLHLLLELPLK